MDKLKILVVDDEKQLSQWPGDGASPYNTFPVLSVFRGRPFLMSVAPFCPCPATVPVKK